MNANQPLETRIPYLEDHTYTGTDLGVTYSPEFSTFKVWSPLAKKAWVNLYTTHDSEQPSKRLQMTLKENAWTLTVHENLENLYYTYSFLHDDTETETADIYSTAVGLNGNRSAIVDLSQTNPSGWANDSFDPIETITDAVIWEVHVEDFSSDPQASFSNEYRGKYLAFTEEGVTVNGEADQPAGLDYLAEAGFNYVHLIPVFDYENNEMSRAYNWGYDPKNYMVPEGKYATSPEDPVSRIKEFKELISALHRKNIGVVMDVVYNHTYFSETSHFQLSVPDYYYRQNSDGTWTNGSGCGNETASERKMMRKYIIDSILYWVEEYHIDGFRFDLMGLHDVTTMNQLRETLNERGHEHVLLYGEPWNAGSVAIFEPNKPADKFHIGDLADGIAIFNDEFRDAIKGSVFEQEAGGFLQGANGHDHSPYSTNDLIASILANTQIDAGRFHLPEEKKWARHPGQVITYASAHDNLTLYDKLVASSNKGSNYERDIELIQMNKINAAILFTSLGGLFLMAGEEWGRTKFGDDNSFKSSIDVNQLDWGRAYENRDLVNYYRGMAAIRQAYAPLRDDSNQTGEAIYFSQLRENVLAYTIPDVLGNSDWSMMAVVVNTSHHPERVELKSSYPLPKEWTILANRHTAGLTPLGNVLGNSLLINPREALVLVAPK
ncbi:type I pullulanase [Alkalibacterium psychrotolerans]